MDNDDLGLQERSFDEILSYDEIALVKMAMLDAADQGVILTVPDSCSFSISSTKVPTVIADKGVAAPYMLSEGPTAEMLNPHVALFDITFDSIANLVPFLEEVMKGGRGLFVMAPRITREVHSTLALNKLRGTFDAVVVECPRFDPFYEAVASLTGATVFDGDSLADFTLEMAGSASQVVADRGRTLVINDIDSQSSCMTPLVRVGGTSDEVEVKMRAIREMAADSGRALDVIELESCSF
ncbi:TCP-1/cpn60 chaperonin family protein [Arabiibacter massiliensis]|uniref:hypothetical protein n=1 Tax=Arabiibacter massiliensis TaxID=1870985 RepID=UPI0009BBC575|nr:hypothetical protein [Arabiibacter massiliensis]